MERGITLGNNTSLANQKSSEDQPLLDKITSLEDDNKALRDIVKKLSKWGEKYPKGNKWANEKATKIENEIYNLAEQAKQLIK